MPGDNPFAAMLPVTRMPGRDHLHREREWTSHSSPRVRRDSNHHMHDVLIQLHMPATLKEAIRRWCRRQGIPMLGVADAARWDRPDMEPWIPEEFRPASIFPETRSVVVIGLPIQLPVLETSPSIWYREHYTTVNHLLDQFTYMLANLLNERGYPSVFVPRDGYAGIEALLREPLAFFSHRHAAYLAGLGNFGTNNMLLTCEYGPRVRFGSVLTAAPLPPDPVIGEELCTHCMQCVEACPSHALEPGSYPESMTDKKACSEYSAGLNRSGISPCGICIKVCPVGRDRDHYMRRNTSIYRSPAAAGALQRSWEHVRRHGRR